MIEVKVERPIHDFICKYKGMEGNLCGGMMEEYFEVSRRSKSRKMKFIFSTERPSHNNFLRVGMEPNYAIVSRCDEKKTEHILMYPMAVTLLWHLRKDLKTREPLYMCFEQEKKFLWKKYKAIISIKKGR